MSRGDFGGPSYGATSASYHRTPMAKEKDKFNSLCDGVSGKIFLLNKNERIWSYNGQQCSYESKISRLEALSKSIDVVDEEKSIESKIHTLSQDSNKIANETKDIFKQIAEYTRVGRYDSHDNRQAAYNLHQNKLRKEFENSLSRYHAIQNVLSLKMKAYIEHEVTVSKDTSGFSSISFNNDQEQLIPVEEKSTQELMLHEEELELAKERESRLHQIEEDILNVNEIFQDLATLVHEQGETVDSIESNIEHAALHVEHGNKELQRATVYQKSARKRLCLILVLATVIASILVIIIYYSVK